MKTEKLPLSQVAAQKIAFSPKPDRRTFIKELSFATKNNKTIVDYKFIYPISKI